MQLFELPINTRSVTKPLINSLVKQKDSLVISTIEEYTGEKFDKNKVIGRGEIIHYRNGEESFFFDGIKLLTFMPFQSEISDEFIHTVTVPYKKYY